MIQTLWFGLGAACTLAFIKAGRICYRIFPYISKSSLSGKLSDNQSVIIAGATDGIGLQYIKLLSNNYKVIAIGRDTAKLQKLTKISPNISIYLHDFALVSLDQIASQQFTSKILEISNFNERIKLKGVINCVGISHFSRYQSTSLENIKKINQTNIQTLHFLLKFVYSCKKLEYLAQKPFFINVSSAVADSPNKYSSVYSATKAYISNLIKVNSFQQKNIDFLDIKPWYVKTKMVSNLSTWDTAEPQDIAQGTFKLLGKRKQGNGCLKHQLIEQFRFASERMISQRVEQLMARIQKMASLRNKRRQ